MNNRIAHCDDLNAGTRTRCTALAPADQTLTDKGSENQSENLLLAFVCHHVHILFILANGLAQQVGHRFVPSTRNRIEHFWAEVNLRARSRSPTTALPLEEEEEFEPLSKVNMSAMDNPSVARSF